MRWCLQLCTPTIHFIFVHLWAVHVLLHSECVVSQLNVWILLGFLKIPWLWAVLDFGVGPNVREMINNCLTHKTVIRFVSPYTVGECTKKTIAITFNWSNSQRRLSSCAFYRFLYTKLPPDRWASRFKQLNGLLPYVICERHIQFSSKHIRASTTTLSSSSCHLNWTLHFSRPTCHFQRLCYGHS